MGTVIPGRACGLTVTVLLTLTLILPGSSKAQTSRGEKPFDVDRLLYQSFKLSKCFSAFVYFEGSAESLGLNKDRLTDSLRLRLKNAIASMPFCKEGQLDGATFVFLRVWTVGKDYPVAFHLDLNAGTPSNARAFEHAILGYGSKEGIEEQVKRSINNLVESFAIAFHKGRGEM